MTPGTRLEWSHFQRLYRRDQRANTRTTWTATNLMECPTCGRIIQTPVQQGGGRLPRCSHSDTWHPTWQDLYGPEIRPPQDHNDNDNP